MSFECDFASASLICRLFENCLHPFLFQRPIYQMTPHIRDYLHNQSCIEMCFQLLESDSMLLNHKWHSQYMNLSNCRNHNEWYQHPNILFNQANYGDFDVLSFFSNEMPLNVSLYWNWCFHIQNSKSEDVEQTQSSSCHIIRFLQSSILAYWFNSILILILFLLILISFLLILFPSHQI